MATEDRDLTRKIRARDAEALRSVVRSNLPMLLRAARAAGIPGDRADDVVQEVFMTFVEKAHTFDGQSRVRTWLFGILYRKIQEARRDARRNSKMRDIEETVESRFKPDGSWARSPMAADRHLHAGDLHRRLQACLEELADRHRQAFVLREVEQLETEEICKILGVSVTNLGVILYRARNRLRECLEAMGLRGSRDAVV
ncbi:MAG: sigma-70 family RNA polymerase sigma factor [Candidatus Eisenbacteria bacterium]|nr:sigma-70 family RNA polymerase sigma factor [Candidatus Eisenbacteria bacterium]